MKISFLKINDIMTIGGDSIKTQKYLHVEYQNSTNSDSAGNQSAPHMASVIQRSHVIPLKSCRVLLSFCCNPHHVGVLLSFCHSLFAYKIRNPSYRSCTLACQEKENSEKKKWNLVQRGVSHSH